MRRAAAGILIFLSTLSFVFALPDIRVAAEVDPGAVLPVYLEGPGAGFEGRITFSDGRVTAASGFTVNGPGGSPAGVMLIGIPGNVRPGPAVLSITGGGETLNKDVMVRERQFREEVIPLTESLTRLRYDDKEERDRQSLELYSILITFNPEAIYDSGPFLEPVSGARITSWFGDRRIYRTPEGDESRSVHAGIDLAAPVGTAISSSGAGRVVFSGSRIITGETVVIEHMPCVYCLYYHLENSFAETGDMVYPGQVIGTLGMTGFATGPHLHWEFRAGGVPVDPDLLVLQGVLDKEAILGKIEGRN